MTKYQLQANDMIARHGKDKALAMAEQFVRDERSVSNKKFWQYVARCIRQAKMPTNLTDNAAFAHPSYNTAVDTAARRAFAEQGECYSVYFDGTNIDVRNSAAAKPKDAKLVCIAQKWDANTVQLRFSGARSEWVNF